VTLADVAAPRLLIYGIGNLGRQDDGLGVRLIERLERGDLPDGVTLESGYQLAPEDALTLSEHDAVVFVDATAVPEAPAPYSLARVAPSTEHAFSTHVLSMGAVLSACLRLYGRAPRAYALAIPGQRFDIGEEISPQAAENLAHAVRDLQAVLLTNTDG
jgi:hydrogenase maturation protease